MAVSSPTGSATLMAIRVAISVPYTSGKTPKSPCGGAHCVEVRNSTGETSRKNREVSSKSTITIPKVVKIERYAQAVSRNFMTRSLASLVRLLRSQASAPDLVPSALIANENPPPPRCQEYGDRLMRPLESSLEVAALRLTFLGEHGAGDTVFVLCPRLLLEACRHRHVLRGIYEPVEVLR